jgi:hypothetical protein
MVNANRVEKGGFVTLTAVLAASSLLLFSADSKADSGFYLGGSVGQAGVQINDGDPVQPIVFDENDFAWKAFGGYNFDVTVVNLAVEGGYVNFGSPSMSALGSQLEVDIDGFDVFGVLGFNLGPIGVFAKAGMISWDAEISVDGVSAGSDDGSDPAYGIGAKFNLGSLNVRAEYEMFDVEDAEDVTMLSVGLVWIF